MTGGCHSKFMDLNSKTFLCDFLNKLKVGTYDENWDLCDKITDPQRKKLLALCYNGEVEEIKEMLESINNLQ